MKRAIQKSTTADTIGLLEAFEEFIEEKEAQNKSPQTIHNYRQTFEAFCKFNGFDRHTSVESVMHILKKPKDRPDFSGTRLWV